MLRQSNEAASADLTPVVTAAALGMVTCHHCDTVWRVAQAQEREASRCGRCGSRLHVRYRDSVKRSWAFLLAAYLLYLPANLLPVMVTTTLLDRQEDTIMSGVIYLWLSGSWFLAAVVFIASIVVPLLKLVILTLLVATAQRHSGWRRRERAALYRMVELVGRWSMLDVFVVALLASLVQMQSFANITAGPGVTAFGAVVVLTMLAALSFDPRLTWDDVPYDGKKNNA